MEKVIFVEVRAGRTSELSETERQIKRAVEAKKVRFITINVRRKFERLADA